jgi:hypothetical protein
MRFAYQLIYEYFSVFENWYKILIEHIEKM